MLCSLAGLRRLTAHRIRTPLVREHRSRSTPSGVFLVHTKSVYTKFSLPLKTIMYTIDYKTYTA